MSDIKDDEKEILLDHDYDSIQELDNPLPKWWLLTFYGAIVLSVFYYAYYELGSGPSSDKELRQKMAAINDVRQVAKEAAFTNVDWEGLLANQEVMAKGREVYSANCTACHGDAGQGVIGPNLTDAYWIHGGSNEEILTMLRKGYVAKGMPPWEGTLPPEDVNAVTAYVISIKGTNPPNPKAPEGEKIN